MNSQKTKELYERFPHLYRERSAPLETSKMGWGFQCEDGWYKILYHMSRQIQKISKAGEYSPAITEVGRNKDGTLYVEARNLTPPIADIITRATEQSRLTCEWCSYSPALLREKGPKLKGHIACGRCADRLGSSRKGSTSKGRRKPLRAPDTIIVKH